MEMSNSNKLNGVEIGANQILLVDELSPPEQELATMEDHDLFCVSGSRELQQQDYQFEKSC
jgi:hypothetical protein